MKQKKATVELALEEGTYELLIPGVKPIMIYVPKQKTPAKGNLPKGAAWVHFTKKSGSQ